MSIGKVTARPVSAPALPASKPIAEPKQTRQLDSGTHPVHSSELEARVETMSRLARTGALHGVTAYDVGEYTTLTGTLAHKANRGAGGDDGVPGGHWLTLDQPIKVDGHEVHELYIDLDGPQGCGIGGGSKCGSCSLSSACTGAALAPGEKLSLNGRLDARAFGGKELPPGTFFAISGVSNPANGEPRFDGARFVSATTGQSLDTLRIVDQANEDRPDNLIVLDPSRRLAFIGNIGGALPEGENPFNAYTAQRPIEFPGTAEREALRFDDHGRPSSVKTGKPLDSIASDREGRVWYLDRDSRTAWGVKNGKVSQLIRLEPGDLLGEPRQTPFGVWQGIDGRGGHGVSTPRDQWVDPNKVVTIPRRMDPALHGTSLVKDTPAVFGSVMSQPDNSIDVEDFYAMLEAKVQELPGGPKTLEQIDATIAEAKRLYGLGLAAKPPLDETMWRRSMIQSYVHSYDLGVVMNAMGFDATGCAGKHDMVEEVPAADLKWQVGRKYMEPWLEKYVTSLPDDAMVNISFLNPHYAAAMAKWGDSRMDANNMMDPHRLSPHHNGNSAEDVSWVEKALNFLAHHMPREHMGIRHQQRGEWSNLEHALSTDPAIKDSEIGKAIARDGAKVWQLLEAEGKVVPWNKLRVPDDVPTPRLERSYEVLQGMNAAGDRGYAAAKKSLALAMPAASAEVQATARAVLSELESLPQRLDASVTERVSGLLRDASTEVDRTVAEELAKGTMARMAQVLVRTPQTFERFQPSLDALTQALGLDKRPYFAPDEVKTALADMAQLLTFADRAEKERDHSTAATLRTWHQLWSEGFPDESISR